MQFHLFRKIGLVTIWLLVVVGCTQSAHAQASAPNMIIILADDLGYADVGFNGCKDIPTPNIDRIAKQGVVFSRGYVSYAVCGPSRAGLITGRYQDRFGFSKNPLLAPNDPEMGLPADQQTLAGFLKTQHYITGAIGKWHLGAHQSLRPNVRGFDEFYGFLSGGHNYLPEKLTLKDLSEAKTEYDGYKTKLLRNNQRVEENEYLTDAFSREAVSFVERHSKQPFFLYLAYNAPHTPLEATEKYLRRFTAIKDEKRRTYAAMISALDDGVGRLLDKIQALHLEKNTIIYFLSDNGGPVHANASSNAPLRGEKGNLFEGGIHVPFCVQWIGHIPQGVQYEQPVISLDIFATAAALVHAKPQNELDGIDLLPYITGRKNDIPHSELYWRHNDQHKYAIVGAVFKRIDDGEKTSQLFNLQKDISEKNNLAALPEYQNTFTDFGTKMQEWLKLLKAPRFLGLLEDAEYLRRHPERWVVDTNK